VVIFQDTSTRPMPFLIWNFGDFRILDFQHPGGRSCSRAWHWSFHGTELSAAGWCCGHQKHGHLPRVEARRHIPGGGDSQADLKIAETTWQFYSDSTVPRCSADVFSWCSAFCRNPPGRRADLGKWRGLLVRSTDSPCQSATLWRCCWDFACPDRRWGAAVSLQLSEL